MDIREMTYITVIAQAGSLSAAAKQLGVSQPTLSVFLSKLEDSLETDLFYREKKQLVPTPAGRIYLSAAQKIISVRDQTYQTIHHLTHKTTEEIVIGASPLRGSIMVAQIFPVFNKRFPDVKVRIAESYMQSLWNNLRERKVNFALASYQDSGDNQFDFINISREELVLGVPSFHPLASRAGNSREPLTSADIREFADTPFVRLAPGTTVRAMMDNIFSTAAIHPPIVFETNNLLVLTNMIRQGAGAGLMPRSSMVHDTDDIVYFSLSPKYYVNLGIVVPRGRILSTAERYLISLVIRTDMVNPTYQPALNSAARDILEEFAEKGDRP